MDATSSADASARGPRRRRRHVGALGYGTSCNLSSEVGPFWRAEPGPFSRAPKTTVEDLNKHNVRVLALFLATTQHLKVEWQANGTTVALLAYNGGEYGVTVDGVRRAMGTIESLFATVKQLSAALEVPPTPTARAYDQFGFWADVQDGQLVHYVTYSDGSWDEDPIVIEFACQHMLARVNADFGTEFTMDEFQEGDCNCKD